MRTHQRRDPNPLNALTIPATVATCLTLTMCPLPSASAAPTPADTPTPRSGPCNLPTTRDLIIWERRPRILDSALEVGDADLMNCKPTLDTWAAGEPTGTGYCSKIAWASDNAGYDINARPAPPLRKVIDQVNDC